MEASEILTQSIDKTQVPPLHQKRILAFVNHFLISSCSFLNEFAAQCEEKFIVLERKMQKVDAALTIIEAKLSSIPDLPGSNEVATIKDNASNESTITSTIANTNAITDTHTVTDKVDANSTEAIVATDATSAAVDPPVVAGIKASEDVRYKKFFKMVQVGVPSNAVKIKMRTEGVDPNILDTPNLILPDGVSS